MNPAPYSSSFGRYLKSIRIQKGIDLESVASEIRVGVGQLAFIEAEDHEHLPDEIYVKGILRAYARCIGVDGDDIVDRYMLNRYDFDATDCIRMRRGHLHIKKTLRWLWATGGIILIIAASIYAICNYHPPAIQHQQAENDQLPADPLLTAGQQGALRLEIDAVEKTWVKVNLDDEEALDYQLNPGDHIELEARSQINMLIGNAGGLNMRLNDKPVNIPGKSGEVVNLELPSSP